MLSSQKGSQYGINVWRRRKEIGLKTWRSPILSSESAVVRRFGERCSFKTWGSHLALPPRLKLKSGGWLVLAFEHRCAVSGIEVIYSDVFWRHSFLTSLSILLRRNVAFVKQGSFTTYWLALLRDGVTYVYFMNVAALEVTWFIAFMDGVAAQGL